MSSEVSIKKKGCFGQSKQGLKNFKFVLMQSSL